MIRKSPRKVSGRREDGAATKAQILEAAGEVFAEKGFERTTGKEIAERAGSNSAAVNYYYGGIDGLHAEVLVEAHRRLVAYDTLRALAEAPGDPADKLRMVIRMVVMTVTGPASWPLRVLSREVLSPSPSFAVLRDREILPKKRIVTGLIGDILGLPHDHDAVARCALSVVAPFVVMLVGDRQILGQVFPGLTSSPAAIEETVAHYQRFAFGGIAAVQRS
jgi:TetR/AcrR family transcriptional regulator, regulator of cefoperazone and chloramphenicol sensitivity